MCRKTWFVFSYITYRCNTRQNSVNIFYTVSKNSITLAKMNIINNINCQLICIYRYKYNEVCLKEVRSKKVLSLHRNSLFNFFEQLHKLFDSSDYITDTSTIQFNKYYINSSTSVIIVFIIGPYNKYMITTSDQTDHYHTFCYEVEKWPILKIVSLCTSLTVRIMTIAILLFIVWHLIAHSSTGVIGPYFEMEE